MSLNTKFSNWEELISHLKNTDPPKCFTVNYLPDDDEFEMWIGNQPFYNYEQLIELEEQEKRELKQKNKRMREALEYIQDISLDKRCEKAARDVLR